MFLARQIVTRAVRVRHFRCSLDSKAVLHTNAEPRRLRKVSAISAEDVYLPGCYYQNVIVLLF